MPVLRRYALMPLFSLRLNLVGQTVHRFVAAQVPWAGARSQPRRGEAAAAAAAAHAVVADLIRSPAAPRSVAVVIVAPACHASQTHTVRRVEALTHKS